MSDGYDSYSSSIWLKSEIKSLKQRVADLEERLTKKDWIVELDINDDGFLKTYLLSDLLINLMKKTKRPHERLEKLEAAVAELKNGPVKYRNQPADAFKFYRINKDDWIS